MCEHSADCGRLLGTPPLAVILAGGKGTRLRSVVSDRPKPMAQVNGRPFLEFIVRTLQRSGVRRVVMCIGHLGEVIRRHFGYGGGWGLEIVYSEDDGLGTGGALRKTLPLLNADPVLVLNGDSYCEVNLEALLTWHLARKARGSLVLTQAQRTGRYGRVSRDADGIITQFEEKIDSDLPGWINAGTYLLAREIVAAIPPDGAFSLERDVFAKLVGQGLFGYPSSGRFLDIGTPESYKRAAQFFPK